MASLELYENELKYIDIRRKIEIKKMSNLMKNEIWHLLNFMIAILVYKYCQQYLYKKKCTSIAIFSY
jgi:hypothetical protein